MAPVAQKRRVFTRLLASGSSHVRQRAKRRFSDISRGPRSTCPKARPTRVDQGSATAGWVRTSLHRCGSGFVTARPIVRDAGRAPHARPPRGRPRSHPLPACRGRAPEGAGRERTQRTEEAAEKPARVSASPPFSPASFALNALCRGIARTCRITPAASRRRSCRSGSRGRWLRGRRASPARSRRTRIPASAGCCGGGGSW